MTSRHTATSALTTAYLLLTLGSGTALSASYGIELTFDQQFAAGGQKSYSVRLAFSRDDVNNKLIAPNGRVFDYLNQYADPLTFEQFKTIAFGQWSAQTAASIIAFRVPSLNQDDVAFKTPVITSPTPGSEVPEIFTINWQGEDRGFAEILKRTNLVSHGSFHPAECCSQTLRNELINPGTGSLTVDVYTRTILPSPQISSQVPAGVDTFTFNARVRSHALPATYTVVPEPATHLMAVLLGVCFGRVRRR